MPGIKIYKLDEIHQDCRGGIYKFIPGTNIKEVILVRRLKGSVSGKHYHKGADESKNPERIIIASGKVNINYYSLSDKKHCTACACQLDVVEISPFVYHELVALEETVFIEPKSDNKYEDVHYPED